MTELDKHLDRVERYGFVRDNFPIEYNGHNIEILTNDAYKLPGGRLLFDFAIYCRQCRTTGSISGRFPAGCDKQIEYVVNAKIATFETFNSEECE
jgi:hypothetical protein